MAGFESWRRRHMWAEFHVCCWFSRSHAPRLVLSRVLRFFPLLKNQQKEFQIPILSGTHGNIFTSSHQLLSAPWVNKLQFTIFFYKFFRSVSVTPSCLIQYCFTCIFAHAFVAPGSATGLKFRTSRCGFRFSGTGLLIFF